MVEIIVVSHGTFAKGLVESAQLIAGDNNDVLSFGLEAGADIELFKSEIRQAICELGKKGEVIVMTDLMCGTPFNLVCSLMEEMMFCHLTGINLPIYLEVYTSRKTCSAIDICKMVKELGPTSIMYVNEMFEGEVV